MLNWGHFASCYNPHPQLLGLKKDWDGRHARTGRLLVEGQCLSLDKIEAMREETHLQAIAVHHLRSRDPRPSMVKSCARVLTSLQQRRLLCVPKV